MISWLRKYFHWHWSNDSRHDQRPSLDGSLPRRIALKGRAWLYRRTEGGGSRKIAQIEWGFPSRTLRLEFGYDDENGWCLSFGCGFFLYLAASSGKYTGRRSRTVSFALHDRSLFWNIWRDPMDGWDRSVPKWRHGAFNFENFLLGRTVYTTREIEKREVGVPMPEKVYPATATLFESTWTRPRWPAVRIMRVEVNVPGGIPHEGKGENSWDCGEDATYGLTCMARSIPEGVGHLVGSVLKDRVRYGGWQDWHWKRAEARK